MYVLVYIILINNNTQLLIAMKKWYLIILHAQVVHINAFTILCVNITPMRYHYFQCHYQQTNKTELIIFTTCWFSIP